MRHNLDDIDRSRHRDGTRHRAAHLPVLVVRRLRGEVGLAAETTAHRRADAVHAAQVEHHLVFAFQRFVAARTDETLQSTGQRATYSYVCRRGLNVASCVDG